MTCYLTVIYPVCGDTLLTDLQYVCMPILVEVWRFSWDKQGVWNSLLSLRIITTEWHWADRLVKEHHSLL